MIIVSAFCITCSCNLVLKNHTWKNRRQQHGLALSTIVHKGNIEETVFQEVDCVIVMYACIAQTNVALACVGVYNIMLQGTAETT